MVVSRIFSPSFWLTLEFCVQLNFKEKEIEWNTKVFVFVTYILIRCIYTVTSLTFKWFNKWMKICSHDDAWWSKILSVLCDHGRTSWSRWYFHHVNIWKWINALPLQEDWWNFQKCPVITESLEFSFMCHMCHVYSINHVHIKVNLENPIKFFTIHIMGTFCSIDIMHRKTVSRVPYNWF